MFLLRRYSRLIALPLAALMLAVSMPLGTVQAAIVGTEQVIGPSQAEADRARVAAFVARDDVRSEMRRMGVDPDEAAARVAVMTDAEVRQVASRIDQLPAGQSAVGAVIGAVVLIFIILLVTDLLGLTDVFPFVKRNR